MQTSHEVDLLSHIDTSAIESVLSFWIGEPARDADAFAAKLQRWFQGGETVDRIIERRFGSLVTTALEGGLDHWAVSLRGRIALVVILDQFTRNLFRSTPRAYAGDGKALALASEIVGTGAWRLGCCEQRLALTLPLAHAEDLPLAHAEDPAMQATSVSLARAMVEDAPAALRGPLEYGAQRAAHYQSIISRFGRFPHRNAILGRTSTADEVAFLEETSRAQG